MRVFLVPQVARLMRKERLPEAALCRTVREVLAGTLGAGEADLGRGLFKKRVARPGGGKRGGYRVIVAYRQPGTERVRLVSSFRASASARAWKRSRVWVGSAPAVFGKFNARV